MNVSPHPGQSWFAATPFQVHAEDVQSGVWILRLSGDIDLDTAPEASEAVRANIGPPMRVVLIDLSGVTFCSSAGLRVLAEAANRAFEHSIDLKLVGPGRPVLRPMEVTGLDAHFLTFASVAAALADGVPSN
jgi:anti-sigma B factor antagonist